MEEILSYLDDLYRRGYSADQVFTDMIDLILYSSIFGTRYERYIDIWGKYPDESGDRDFAFHCCSQAADLVYEEMTRTSNDLLGLLYVEWNMRTTNTASFIIPTEHSNILNRITTLLNKPSIQVNQSAILKRIATKETVSIMYSFYCGSGTLLIDTLRQYPPDNNTFPMLFAFDEDLLSVKITAINLFFFKAYSTIVCADIFTSKVTYILEVLPVNGRAVLNELDYDDFELVVSHIVAEVENTIEEARAELSVPGKE